MTAQSVYTRDASGTRRRITATGETETAADTALSENASRYALTSDIVNGGSPLGDLLESWYADMVEARSIREQPKRSGLRVGSALGLSMRIR